MGHTLSTAIRWIGFSSRPIQQVIIQQSRSASLTGASKLLRPDVLVQNIDIVQNVRQTVNLRDACKAGTGSFDYALMTTVIGGFTVLAMVGYTGYSLYTRNKRGSGKVEQAQSKRQLTQQQLQKVQWEHIQMKEQLFQDLVTMTQPKFINKVKEFICPQLKEVMRKPCFMKCCKDLATKLPRVAEKVILQSEIKQSQRCILCLKKADQSFIELDEDLEDRIVGFRHRIYKTYRSLHSSQKQKWGKLIDSYFGRNYTQKHLGEPVKV